MNLLEHIRIIFEFPNMPEDEASEILYGCTGWPCFWRGKNPDPIRIMTYQLRHAKRAMARGFSIDDIYSSRDGSTPWRIDLEDNRLK